MFGRPTPKPPAAARYTITRFRGGFSVCENLREDLTKDPNWYPRSHAHSIIEAERIVQELAARQDVDRDLDILNRGGALKFDSAGRRIR